MSWKVNRYGTVESGDSASDADQDAAMALLYAHRQWGSRGSINYFLEAKKLIAAIMSAEVYTKANDYVIKPGADWGGQDIINPSYFNPAYYPAWSLFDRDWLKVADRSHKIYNIFAQRYGTGLVPDWCVPEGSTSYLSYNFTYDACRVPLKIGLDHLWHGRGYEHLDKLCKWAIKESGGDPETIVDGYKLDGKAIGRYNNAAFVGPLMVAAMVSGKHQAWLNKGTDHLIGLPTGGRWGYYNDSLRLLSLLILSGNLPDLWQSPLRHEEEEWLRGALEFPLKKC
jgi:endo-1,4-beta-D-glucanase Y